jgi:hypothetical protein
MNTQVIPTYVHAMGDYITSTTAPYAARRMGVNSTTRRIVDGMAAMAGAQSLITDYEGGAMPVMPMRAHLAADMAMGVGLLSTAALVRHAPAKDRQLLAGLGAFSLVYALMTRPDRSQRRSGDSHARAIGRWGRATMDTASTTPPHGDVLEQERFTSSETAHVTLAD